jgi:hypothetical protein
LAEEGSISERGASPPSRVLSPSPNIMIQGFLQSLCLERGFTLRFLPEGIKGVRVKWGEVQVISKKQKRTESYYLTLHLLSIKLFL